MDYAVDACKMIWEKWQEFNATVPDWDDLPDPEQTLILSTYRYEREHYPAEYDLPLGMSPALFALIRLAVIPGLG